MVSPTAGTTTDPVRKAMELLPLGPVVILDTPGFDDDEGEPGAAAGAPDLSDPQPHGHRRAGGGRHRGLDGCDRELLDLFKEKKDPLSDGVEQGGPAGKLSST